MFNLIKKYSIQWGYKSFALLCLTINAPLALASDASTDMPWVDPLNKILATVTGPVAKALGVIAIVIAGLGIAFGEAGSGVRKLFQVVFGLSIAFTAGSLVVSLFGFSGGATF